MSDLTKYRIPVPQEVLDFVGALTVADCIKHCTPRGKGGYIKKSKPKNGIMAYIWRHCRFHNGDDMHMPMTDLWDLCDGIKDSCGVEIGISTYDTTRRELCDILDKLVDATLDAIPGQDKNRNARRWVGLL